MGLKFKERTIREVDYNDLDQFVNDTLFEGKPVFEIACVEEASNDSVKKFLNLDGKLSDYEEKDVLDYIESRGEKYIYGAYDVLNYLCREGYLEKGDYFISISW